MKRLGLLASVIALAVAAAGCGSSGSTSSPTSSATTAKNSEQVGGKLVIGSYLGTTWSCQFNPFNPADNVLSVGFVYEPMEYINILQPGSPPRPWLATGSAWSNNNKTLTFTIRSGVKWNDGTPFTANDVAYTFNAMKTSPAMDLNAIWAPHGGPLTSVSVKGSNQVVFTFSSAAQTYFYYVAYLTPIIPQHIWSSLDQSKLASYADSNPVGTGPYKVANCVQTNVKYLRNPSLLAEQAGPSCSSDLRGRLPGLPRQQPDQPVPHPGPSAVGRPAHPQHQHHVYRQGSGAPPCLVPADPQRLARTEPDQPATEEPSRA